MLLEQKSLFAKLLANENIDIQYVNTNTAFFDLETRTLGIPPWNDEETYDLLLGHEVSHALHTPYEEWNEQVIKGDLKKSLVNIVEDVRIERLIQKRYPGLVRDFRQGYRAMLAKNIFKLGDQRHFTAKDKGFLDRLNLKAKCGSAITVEFSTEEQELFDACFETETFQDVLDLSRKITEFVKKNAEEEIHIIVAAMFDKADDCDDDPGDEDFDGEPLDTSGASQPSDEKDDGEETSDDDTVASTPTSAKRTQDLTPEDIEKAFKASEDGEDENGGIDSADSQSIDRLNENSGAEVGDGAFQKPPATLNEKAGAKFDELLEKKLEKELTAETQETMDEEVQKQLLVKAPRYGTRAPLCKPLSKATREKLIVKQNPKDFRISDQDREVYTKFLEINKDTIANMVREFEIRKKAAAYKKAKIVKKGSLNVNKLYRYKFDDELFVRGMKLPNGKSHGMCMLIDASGSMGGVIDRVVRQTIQLVIFCQKVGIPFAVYSFTTSGYLSMREIARRGTTKAGELITDHVLIKEWLSSEMKAEDIRKMATYMLTDKITGGGTPLVESLIALQPVIKNIKDSKKLDRMNFVVLTDGAGGIPSVMSHDGSTYGNIHRMQLDRNTTYIADPSHYYDRRFGDMGVVENVLNWYRKSGAADRITHFFLMDHNLWKYAGLERVRYKNQSKLAPAIRHNVGGYDTKIMIHTRSNALSGQSGQLHIDEHARKKQIIDAFKEHAGSARKNRVITQSFIEGIS